MILADTSVWIDHLRSSDERLVALLERTEVVMHPFVTGELALRNLAQRAIILGTLQDLPQASVASDEEVLHFIEKRSLLGRGIGYVDAHLLAAVQLTPVTSLWTRDKRLHATAVSLSLAAKIV
jgi:predicted nucleic acid-binding protein